MKKNSLNRRGNTLFTLTECHYKKKKKKTTTKENYKKILSPKPWPWEEKSLLSGSVER